MAIEGRTVILLGFLLVIDINAPIIAKPPTRAPVSLSLFAVVFGSLAMTNFFSYFTCKCNEYLLNTQTINGMKSALAFVLFKNYSH